MTDHLQELISDVIIIEELHVVFWDAIEPRASAGMILTPVYT